MSESRQRIWAPIIILVVLVFLWEALVTAFNIQQFLLPKPSAIAGNLVQVVVLDGSASRGDSDAELSLDKGFIVLLSGELTPEVRATMQEARWLEFGLGDRSVSVLRGSNLTPILAASWFTLKEALGGMAMGTLAGIAVALATTRWSATRRGPASLCHRGKFDAYHCFCADYEQLVWHRQSVFENGDRDGHDLLPHNDQYLARVDFGR